MSTPPSKEVPDSKMRKTPQGEVRTGLLNCNPIFFSFLKENDKTKAKADLKAMSSYVCTSKFPDKLSLLFAKALQKEKQARFISLLLHITRGEQKEAEEIIKKDPAILLNTGTVIDYSEREIEGTPYRIALGAEDVKVSKGKKEECMVEMLERYLRKLTNGEFEILKQQAEQFSKGSKEAEEKKHEEDLAELKKITHAIEAANSDADCKKALDEFREYLRPKNIIKSGKHFNVRMLAEAFKLYDKNYYHFGGSGCRKNNLYLQQVIGHIQRYLPACYAQVFCQGLYFIVDRRHTLKRCLILPDGFRYYPLDSDPSFRLGYECAIPGMIVPTLSGVGEHLGACRTLMLGYDIGETLDKLISRKCNNLASAYAAEQVLEKLHKVKVVTNS